MLEIRQLAIGYDEPIIKDLSLEVKASEFVCVIGANGIGKTTLFKTLLRILPKLSGQVLLDGTEIEDFSTKEFAKKVAYVPQAHVPPFPFEVIDVVIMGRTAALGTFAVPSKQDVLIAENLLELLGIEKLKNKKYTEISGGERQMTLIARALAQEAGTVILDEPASSLDLGNQWKIFTQIRKLAKKGLGILMSTHNPNHVLSFADKTLAIFEDSTWMFGETNDVLTSENLSRIYGLPMRICTLDDGEKVCVLKK